MGHFSRGRASPWKHVASLAAISGVLLVISGCFLLEVPATPTDLAVSDPVLFTLTVSWNEVNNASEYKLERDGAVVYTGGNHIYVDSGLTPNNYQYAVAACDLAGCSDFSSTLTVNSTTGATVTTGGTGGSYSGTYSIAVSSLLNVALAWGGTINTSNGQLSTAPTAPTGLNQQQSLVAAAIVDAWGAQAESEPGGNATTAGQMASLMAQNLTSAGGLCSSQCLPPSQSGCAATDVMAGVSGASAATTPITCYWLNSIQLW